MDDQGFKEVAGPILAEALTKVNTIASEYYSDEYLEALPPTNESIEEYKNDAKNNIETLNAFKSILEPKEAGHLSVDIPSPLKGLSDEWKIFEIVESTKDELISNLCRAYGLKPPPVQSLSQLFILDQSSLKDLIVHLASENLKTPLKRRPRGGVSKSKREKEYLRFRDEIMTASITQIKSELGSKSSDEKVVAEIVRRADKSSEFGISCLKFRNFFLRITGNGYNSASIKNRISRARRRAKSSK